jgi:hypothetical protein
LLFFAAEMVQAATADTTVATPAQRLEEPTHRSLLPKRNNRARHARPLVLPTPTAHSHPSSFVDETQGKWLHTAYEQGVTTTAKAHVRPHAHRPPHACSTVDRLGGFAAVERGVTPDVPIRRSCTATECERM